jgi:hypothetical protein
MTAMCHTSQTLHPVPTVFGAGFIAPRFEDEAPAKLIADGRESRKMDYARRLRALVWCEEN